MLCFSGCRLLGSGFRDNKWILLISFGCTNVDFVGGRWISLFRQTEAPIHKVCPPCGPLNAVSNGYIVLITSLSCIF